MKHANVAPPKDALTSEEQKLHLEELLLKRCSELRRIRAARKRAEMAIARRQKQPLRPLQKCLTCGAYKFLMASSKKKRGK